MQRIVDALQAVDADIEKGDLAVDSDFTFHAAIAEATGNQCFARFLDFMRPLIIPRQTLTRTHGGADAGYLRGIQLERQRIFKSIEAGSSTGARKAMRAYLANASARYCSMADDYARVLQKGLTKLGFVGSRHGPWAASPTVTNGGGTELPSSSSLFH